VGGVSALLLGVEYIVIIPLYLFAGIPPNTAAEWLTYGVGKTDVWWAIVGLSVVTDLLFLPVAFALYLALRSLNRYAMVFATIFVGLFVVLDLAVTWPSYAALITESAHYAAATTDAARAASLAAAEYASAVLHSAVEAVYSIALLSIGIFAVGLVMLRGVFNRATAYVGLATGFFGILSVVGPFVVRALGTTVILASVLTTVWVLLVGYRLMRLG
jgi:hypothetical protein